MHGSRFQPFATKRVARTGRRRMLGPTLIRTRLIATLAFVLMAAPAGAIIGGEFDGTRHPYVGAVIGPNFGLCSGTAISATLVVTAAHCFESKPGQRVAVSFDADLFGVKDGDPDPHFVFGTFHPDPEFCFGCGPAPTAAPGVLAHDSGVVILDHPGVALERYARLPSEGQIATLANTTRVDIVGYGLFDRPKDFDPTVDTIPRIAAVAEVNPGKAAFGDDWVRLSANPGQDKGRICFGDSGGPALLGDTILATTSFVGSRQCIGIAYSYRLDTAAALAFIGQDFAAPSGRVAAASTDQRGPAKHKRAKGDKNEGDKKVGKNGRKTGHGKHTKRD